MGTPAPLFGEHDTKFNMRSRFLAVLFLQFVLTLFMHAAEPRVQVLLGVDGNGRATQQWQEMIAKRLPEAKFREIESLTKPYTPAELAWVRLLQAHQPQWEREVPKLAVPFSPVAAPDARIVLGNRGGEDAFTHDPHTIGFDVERLNALYGDAESDKNVVLIDHLFRHEYTHLLQKAWVRDHPLDTDTPLEGALAEMWLEGMGNYYSLSDTWRLVDGKPSPKAAEALRLLEPRLMTRLAALACSTPENAHELSRNLSSGQFDRKWGALPVALWLESESASNPEFLRDFIVAGENGVWALASRNVAPALKSQLEEIRAVQKACSGK
jgi:hypothetical protein